MQEMITQNIKMIGEFETSSFQNWIRHRADILNVDVEINSASSCVMELSASGHPILVEALEIACSLGPMESTVDSIVSA
jgi:hypothetical protein